ncbi:MAG: thermostable hemolysin [Gallionellaceae bacterium]
MVALRRKIKASTPQPDRAAVGSASGAYARPLLLSKLCRDVQDTSFCEGLTRLFDLAECIGSDRVEVEAFIRETFALAYGANVTSFMPRLLAVCRKDGDLLAAFGVRSAKNDKLFLENYIDHPIEQVIEEKTGVKLERGKIVEIGNLAAIYPGGVRWMIVALTVMLYEEGYEWVVFTGTSTLRNGFNKLGLYPIDICPARVDLLDAEEQARWGTYYDNKPTVMFGNIRQGFQAMSANPKLLKLLNGENGSFFRVLHPETKTVESE